MKYFPLPNTPGAALTNANNYYNQGSSTLDIDQMDGRFDHNFTATPPPVRALQLPQPGQPARGACGLRN